LLISQRDDRPRKMRWCIRDPSGTGEAALGLVIMCNHHQQGWLRQWILFVRPPWACGVEFSPYNLLCLLTGYNNNKCLSRYQGQGGQWYPLRELNGRTSGEHICTSINVMMLMTIQIALLFTLLQHKFHSSLKFSIEKQQYIIIGLQQQRTIDRLFGDSGVSLLSLYSLQSFMCSSFMSSPQP
jgi:hypothetical protein